MRVGSLRHDPEMLQAYVERRRRMIEVGATDSTDYSEVKGESPGRDTSDELRP